MRIFEKIKEYKDNEIVHVFFHDGKVYAKTYCNMFQFAIFNTSSVKYNDALECYIAKTITSIDDNCVELCNVDAFMKQARLYKARYKVRCYKAIYAEIVAAKAFGGRHNRYNTEHSEGDFIANGKRYEVKFGNEVTI